MENQNRLMFFFLLSVLITGNQFTQVASHCHGHHHHHQRNVSRFFVFGDSYADTGNSNRNFPSWNMPYGITFPGKPAGRYSDGRIFTDYLASYLRLRSPVPYKWRKIESQYLCRGMNFAYGGTGVYDTHVGQPNMTTQIDFFEKIIKTGLYSKHNLHASIAYVSAAGNDYATFVMQNGTIEGLPGFVASVVKQISLNLKRIHGLGVRKVVVAGLQPVGCLPASTALTLYKRCIEEENLGGRLHNQLLKEAVATLNRGIKDSPFVILDFNNAFLSALNGTGSMKFQSTLKPCCLGVGDGYCGSVDEHGLKMYTVCENPKSAFFWDTVHPSQQGWLAVYSALQGSLNQIFK